MRWQLSMIAGVAFAVGGNAQNTEPLTFDAASIKAAPAPEGGRGFMMGWRGGPGTDDPTTYRCTNCTILMMLRQAYDMKSYQIISPGWMERGDRFEITAKVPKDATKEQFRTMLQNFLAERFKLAAHREKKEMQVYEMVVAKGGPKLKEYVDQPKGPADDAPPAPPESGRGRGRGPNVDADGFPIIPKDCNGCIMVVGGGKARMAMQDTMKGLADMLADQMGKPVSDATGLKAKYDISVTYQMTPGGRGGLPPPPGGGDRPAPADNSTPLGSSDGDTGVPLVGAVQSQLGLKLESKKGSAEVLVIDRAEKTPTEN